MRYSNIKEYKVVHRCARCGRKAVFINTGRFRVNGRPIPRRPGISILLCGRLSGWGCVGPPHLGRQAGVQP